MNKHTVYVPVSVSDRLPKINKWVVVETTSNRLRVASIEKGGKWDEYPFTIENEKPVIWLEKLESVYVLTEQELNEYTQQNLSERDKHWEFQLKVVARDAAEKAYSGGFFRASGFTESTLSKEQYLEINHPLK